MKKLICAGAGRVGVVDVPVPEPGHGEALVRIEASAVCGSERGVLTAGMNGNAGHEAAGILEHAPAGCGFEAGQRVGMTAVAGCGECERCRIGQEIHCRRGPKVSSGWHAGYAVVPASTLRAVPPGTDAGVAAMLTGDPLGVPVRALARAHAHAGDRVVVVGLGPVGLAHVLVRSFVGCRVIGVEPSSYRRDLALALGASEVCEPGTALDRAPLVIECTGRPECIAAAFEMADNGGTVVQSGECHTDVPLNPSGIFIRREVTYTGAWYYATEDYAMMRRLVEAGLRLPQLRTHDVDATQAQDAITDFLTGNSGKVVLRWS